MTVAAARDRERLHLLLVLSAAAALLWPFLGGGLPMTHEGDRYVFLLDAFTGALRAGALYPRWLPGLFGGYGYPEFVYYQPGFFFLAAPFYLLASNPDLAVAAVLWLMLAAGGAAVYRVCRRSGPPEAALLGALLFLLTPYLRVNLWVRGDWSELAGMAACPFALLFVLRLRERGRAADGAGLALSLAGVLACHPLVFLVFCPALAAVAASLGGDRAFLLRCAAGLGGALVLSSVYWAPAFLLRGQAAVETMTQGYNQPALHVVEPGQLLSRAWGFGGSAPGPEDTMSFQLGLPHLALLLGGMAAARRDRLVLAAGAAALLLALAMTTAFTGFWAAAGPLKILQFPWRLLSVVALFQAVAAAGLGRLAEERKWSPRAAGGAAALLLALSALFYGNGLRRSPPFLGETAERVRQGRQTVLQSFQTFDILEFLPRTARKDLLRPSAGGPLAAAVRPGASLAFDPENDAHRISFAVSSEGPNVVLLRQLYFPGWRVLLNGEPLADEVLARGTTPAGLISFEVPAGVTRVRAFYGSPPGARAGFWLSAALLAAAAAWAFLRRRRGGLPA